MVSPPDRVGWLPKIVVNINAVCALVRAGCVDVASRAAEI
jgi:hypothetical protein